MAAILSRPQCVNDDQESSAAAFPFQLHTYRNKYCWDLILNGNDPSDS